MHMARLWRTSTAISCALAFTAGPAAANKMLSDYRLEFDTPVDARLQADLEAIDRRLGEELGIPEADRACGVLDLTDLRLAMVRPDAMFYGASVPKIGILLAYFETNPDAAERLDPQVERELQLMIKRSDNDLAAKYSQLVGLDTIQRILQSDKYRLYTREHGGLWCGKHYGIDQPRTGDPVHDHSHAAAVRQCLRYYLMLEQGRLVCPGTSAKMKAIFTAPLLDFHNDNFVKGLNGRDVTMIRKNGEWEDWHLDTARVQHGDRAYLIAAMTHHPKGREYLAGVAAAVDERLCGRQPPKPYSHQLHLHDRHEHFRQGTVINGQLLDSGVVLRYDNPMSGSYESSIIESDFPFNEALPSWNARVPVREVFNVQVRVGRRFDDYWSPYLYVGGEQFTVPPSDSRTECDAGRIAVDYFTSHETFDRVQYRVVLPVLVGGCGNEPIPEASRKREEGLLLTRFALCLSDTTGIPRSVAKPGKNHEPVIPERWQRRIAVPHNSQATERPEMKSKICSPASVAMVLEYRGMKATPEQIAFRALDASHNIYGNWPYNVQAAYTYGVPGYVTRFSDWHEVEQMIADGQPLVISIRYKEGEMPAAPMKSTDGHLVVLCGFDQDGNALINDPATSDPARGQYACRREHLETAWLRHGGTAYVLLPAEPQKP